MSSTISNPTTVIYHSADYDGIFCREIAKKFLPKDTVFIGWNFGDPIIEWPLGHDIYVMDLPLDKPFGLSGLEPTMFVPDFFLGKGGSMTWIDHHKTAIDTHPPGIPGYRIDGVAACRLAWQWFTQNTPDNPGPRRGVAMPDKQDFVERRVCEPLAVRLAGEYDVWDHRGDGDLEFQYGLKAEIEPIWDALLSELDVYTNLIISQGRICMRYQLNMDALWLKEAGHIIDWEGIKFLAKNSVERGSGMFDSKDVPETGHDALMLYGYRGSYWTVSMYHAKHRTDIDLSVIAKKYGGGGHRGACGFTSKTLPFTL
jgi:hypothetical protein